MIVLVVIQTPKVTEYGSMLNNVNIFQTSNEHIAGDLSGDNDRSGGYLLGRAWITRVWRNYSPSDLGCL